MRYDNHINGILEKYGFEVVQPAFDDFKAVYTQSPDNLSTYLGTAEEDLIIAKIAGTDFKESDFGRFITENGFRYRRMEAAREAAAIVGEER